MPGRISAVSARLSSAVERTPRTARARPARRPSRPAATQLALPRLSVSAWGLIGVTATFVGLTCWWVTQDRSIPIFDAGTQLGTAIQYHDMLRSGDILGPFNHVSQYPPLVHLVGAIAMFLGGVGVATPIIAANLIFVPLLTLGCYKTGELLYGRGAGLPAAIFVLGSPLLSAQFHVFMLDAPETALVSVSIWLLLASRQFSRLRFAAWAGLAVGCGLLVKVTFPFFLAGIVLLALARGGWRNWRNLGVFLAVALIFGAPWYLDHLSELATIAQLGGRNSGAVAGNLPPTLSSANLLWYFWSSLNSQLLAPLALLVLGGAIWTGHALLRRPEAKAVRLEFIAGGFLAWLAISLTPHHDIRYDMPLMPYLAVLATGWIVHLPRTARVAATAFTVLAVLAATLGSTFGVGKTVEFDLVHSPPATEALPDRVVVYSTSGFLVGAPQRDGDVPGLLDALRSSGVGEIVFSIRQSEQPDFSFEGLLPLARISGLQAAITPTVEFGASSKIATLVHRTIDARFPPPCRRLADGTGVWVLRFDPTKGKPALFCPESRPQFYSTKLVS